jgi:hypothetical protein
MKKKEARPTSPLVVLVKVPSTLRFPPLLYSIIIFLTQGSFSKILDCNLLRYCICSPYCCYTCDLNILGTRIVTISGTMGTTYHELGGKE